MIAILASLALQVTPVLQVPVLAASSNSNESYAVPEKVAVGVSQQKVLNFPGLSRVAVGDPGIADVHVQSTGEVIVTGKSVGHTTLIVWKNGRHESHTIEVSNRQASQIEKMVRSLSGAETVTVEEFNGHLVVQGRVDGPEVIDRIKTVLSGEGDVAVLVEVDRQAKSALVQRINQALFKAGYVNAKATLIGKRIFLEGQVEDEASRSRAQLIAESIVGEPVTGLP